MGCEYLLTSRTKFGEPFQIAPVQNTQGPSNQIQLKKKLPRVETLPNGNAEIGNNFLNSFVGFFKLAVPQFSDCQFR